jgi:hypothetical protein
LWHGYGKEWLNHARMFVGQWRFGKMYEGKLYEMQDGEDSKFDLYEVKYDAIKDRDNKVLPDNQVPILK